MQSEILDYKIKSDKIDEIKIVFEGSNKFETFDEKRVSILKA